MTGKKRYTLSGNKQKKICRQLTKTCVSDILKTKITLFVQPRIRGNDYLPNTNSSRYYNTTLNLVVESSSGGFALAQYLELRDTNVAITYLIN